MSTVDIVRRIFQLGDVERINASANCLCALLLYSLLAIHQIRLYVRVYTRSTVRHKFLQSDLSIKKKLKKYRLE